MTLSELLISVPRTAVLAPEFPEGDRYTVGDERTLLDVVNAFQG